MALDATEADAVTMGFSPDTPRFTLRLTPTVLTDPGARVPLADSVFPAVLRAAKVRTCPVMSERQLTDVLSAVHPLTFTGHALGLASLAASGCPLSPSPHSRVSSRAVVLQGRPSPGPIRSVPGRGLCGLQRRPGGVEDSTQQAGRRGNELCRKPLLPLVISPGLLLCTSRTWVFSSCRRGTRLSCLRVWDPPHFHLFRPRNPLTYGLPLPVSTVCSSTVDGHKTVTATLFQLACASTVLVADKANPSANALALGESCIAAPSTLPPALLTLPVGDYDPADFNATLASSAATPAVPPIPWAPCVGTATQQAPRDTARRTHGKPAITTASAKRQRGVHHENRSKRAARLGEFEFTGFER